MANRKLALITGGAVRIGAAFARGLAANGYDLIIHYRNSHADALALKSELCELGAAVTLVQGDIDANAGQMFTPLLHQVGTLDLLINNASGFYPTPISTATAAQFDDLFNSNAKGPLFIAKACAPYLKKAKGCIINIADIWGEFPKNEHSIYCMAKAANIMLTKALAIELAPEVRVNAISPGEILAPKVDGNVLDHVDADAHIPLAKLGGEHTMVEALMMLINSSYMTGEVIKIDGGKSLCLHHAY